MRNVRALRFIHTISHDMDEAQEQETRQANARLIAAAPDLLAVCKALLGIVQGRKELREKWPHCIE